MGEGLQCPPPVPWCAGLELPRAQMADGVCYHRSYASIHTRAHTHTHTATGKRSDPMSSLSSRLPALLLTMLGPRFVPSSTYPPSVVSHLAQVCTVGLLPIQGVSWTGSSAAQCTITCPRCFIHLPNCRPTGRLFMSLNSPASRSLPLV